jgi:hypothetical protein
MSPVGAAWDSCIGGGACCTAPRSEGIGGQDGANQPVALLLLLVLIGRESIQERQVERCLDRGVAIPRLQCFRGFSRQEHSMSLGYPGIQRRASQGPQVMRYKYISLQLNRHIC